ncbi:aspartate aminotransferase family protein [Burkholderia arboris]|uniref:aspartate aminotransferase family protein n=1 Tax=Burkholderia arboris TaxID=488730 RepID=UPI00158C6DAE|nr:aspartate aminotransferase family protein [Burkholderia arboris]MBY8606323.1 aspartate aminotransferase family protein [Burkholderia arboris]
MDTTDSIVRRQNNLGPAYRLFYDEPVHAKSAEGVWIVDVDGKRYLDVYNNVPSVGHAHPGVVAAISSQMAVLATHTRYVEERILEYSDRLLALFPAALDKVMFTCTGSEANDLALRVARAATNGTGIIVTRLAYHGVTSAIAEISPSFGAGVPLGQHVRTVPAPDTYRTYTNGQVASAFAESVAAAVADMRRHGIQPAALIVDTIFSSDGIFGDPAGFLGPAVDLIRNEGGLFIADEVQAGFGRTGSAMWGFERHGVVPDIVTLGKPMGNGYPVAGIVARTPLIDAFASRTRYFNTFGGNPVASAAGLAVLNAIRDQGLMLNVQSTGHYFRSKLLELQDACPLIGDIRGAGFFIGVDLVKDRQTKAPLSDDTPKVVNGMRRKGVLISATGPYGNVLKLRPQLIFQPDHVDLFMTNFEAVLSDVTRSLA